MNRAGGTLPLPFELTAPTNTSLGLWDNYEGANDGELLFNYSANNSIVSYFADTEEAEQARHAALESLGYDDLWIEAQLDWALDDPEDWHYTQYYDYDENDVIGREDPYGEDIPMLSIWDAQMLSPDMSKTVNDAHVFSPVIATEAGVDYEDWVGGGPFYTPLRDQLKEGQYFLKYDEIYDQQKVFINYDEHTAYVRARFIVTVQVIDHDEYGQESWHIEHLYSEWSTPAAYGKNAVKWEPYTKEDIPAPVITDFHMTNEDFNGYPIVSYTLTVPDEVATTATEVMAHGGQFYIESYARLKGTEEWTLLQGDTDVKSGEMQETLVHLVKDTVPESKNINRFSEIELRCCYYFVQYDAFYYGNFLGEFRSEYSPVITFESTELTHEPTGISVRGISIDGYHLLVEEAALDVTDLEKAYTLWLETEDGTRVDFPANAFLEVKIPYADDNVRVSSFSGSGDTLKETRLTAKYENVKYVFETNPLGTEIGTFGLLTRTIGSGDVNADNNVDIADALMISRHDAKLITLTDEQLAVGDVNGDNEVDIADALMISRYDAKLIEGFN